MRDLRSYADKTAIVLTWGAPTTAYTDIVVRYAKGTTAPAHPAQGHRVVLRREKATSATLAHLSPDTTYVARVWARDRNKHLSTAATVRFTTVAKPTKDGTMAGRVTDKAGHPLAHAAVSLYSYGFSFAEFDTSTHADGTFSTAVPAGEYYVQAAGSSATGGDSDATGYLSSAVTRSVSPGRHRAVGTIRLDAGGAVTGRVTDATGRPLAGVMATLTTPPSYVWKADGGLGLGSELAGATTAADGTFTIKSVPRDAVLTCYDASGAHLVGSGSATGYDNQCSDSTVSVAPGTTRSLADVHLVAAAAGSAGFAGHVTGPGRKPVADAWVTFLRRGDSFENDDTYTAANGSYSEVGLTPGTYKICIDTTSVVDTSPTGVVGRCLSQRVTLAAGQVRTLDVSLTRAAAASGTVTDHRGHRLANVSVYLKLPGGAANFAGETDERGQYLAKNLTPGTSRICFDPALATVADRPANAASACAKGGAKIATQAGRVRTGVDGYLPAGGSIRGRVTDGNKHPVANVAVHVTPVGGDNDRDEETFPLTGSDGSYAVTGLAAGKYTVCFDAYGFDTSFFDAGPSEVGHCVRPATKVTADHATPLDIDLPVSAAIDVTVHDSDGHPVAGVNAVALRSCNAGTSTCSTAPLFGKGKHVAVANTSDTGGDGEVVLDGLAPGNYAVCLFAFYGATVGDTPATGYADTCTGSTYDIAVGKGGTAHISLTLSVGGVVSGTVTDTAGHPVRGALVRVAGSAATDYDNGGPDFGEGPLQHAVTAADGSYSVRSVRPGSRSVCIDASAAKGRSAGGYLDQCLGSVAGSTSGGTSVTVAAGSATSGVDVHLTAAGAISGHVTLDGKTGSDVQYIVMRPDGTWVDGSDDPGVDTTTSTNANGNYKHLRLPAGTYVVCFYEDGYRAQCYDNVAWNLQNLPAKAARIDVTAGQLVTGVDADLRKK